MDGDFVLFARNICDFKNLNFKLTVSYEASLEDFERNFASKYVLSIFIDTILKEKNY